MTQTSRRLGVLVLLIAGAALTAAADTISFSGLSTAGSGATNEGTSYTQQGFIFTDLANSGFGTELAAWQASSPNLPGGSTANTSLLEFFANSTTRLTETGNIAFTLNSIDLAQYDNETGSFGNFSVTFTGTHADSSTVSQTFTGSPFNGTPTLHTFLFSGFTNVVKVDFTQGIAAQGQAYQFDNVVVNATPEPGTFFLVGISLVGLGVTKKFLRRA